MIFNGSIKKVPFIYTLTYLMLDILEIRVVSLFVCALLLILLWWVFLHLYLDLPIGYLCRNRDPGLKGVHVYSKLASDGSLPISSLEFAKVLTVAWAALGIIILKNFAKIFLIKKRSISLF